VKIVTVARKPILGSATQNVIDHGCGALNIDGCRTNTPPRATGTKTSGDGQNRGPDAKLRQGSGRDSQRAYDDNLPSGRWPANLILQHLPDCRQTGTTTVPGYTINRWTDGAKPFGGGAGHEYESEKQPEESIAVWECVEGCAVEGLDEQSGVKTSGTMKREVEAYAGASVTGFLRGVSGPHNQHGDSGTASRFFKQVKEHE
jgi:hypothetical protein